ncbi:hypothetical protein GCM10010249_59730 [Streptomyces roseolilacinus]|uniref:Uncharacterized protein n=1 Tax=Streptomyces roseolilacinus TaxID=66904 RepID=A0A918B6S1_9ACTN|nr:hypothetical protein GCM10010249_59730 [Streptomyces roseolilacinus]
MTPFSPTPDELVHVGGHGCTLPTHVQPVKGQPARSAEGRTWGKPVHRPGACPEEKPKVPTKPDPASTLPKARGGRRARTRASTRGR